MAGQDRLPTDPVALLRALEETPYAFDFLHALRCVEHAFPERPRIGESKKPLDDPIRFGQEPSLAFAPSTLAAFERSGRGRAPRLAVRFFGLLGPNGPLPLHLTEYARDRVLHAGDRTFSRFLDVFHHRLLSLFYRVWARAQPTVSVDRPGVRRYDLYLGALIGMGFDSLRGRDSVPDAARLSLAGLLARHVKNAAGLRAALQAFFRVPVQIVEGVGNWMDLPAHSYSRLAHAGTATLGREVVIGERVWDLQNKFRVVIGPLSLQAYLRFLPTAASFRRLADWIRTYLGFELKWECQLVLRNIDVPPLLLGYGARLGWTSWLGVRLGGQDAADLVLAGR